MTAARRALPGSRRHRLEEAIGVLKALGVPAAQLNDRSALTLLALLDLAPAGAWKEADDPVLGVTPIMTFAARNYGKRYAPNSRETFRRFSLHQFVDAGLVIQNPGTPLRAINSPKWCYQIAPAALNLLRTYDTPRWEANLEVYLASVGSLSKEYAQHREQERIPLELPDGGRITLSPGGQNELVMKIITEFCPRFTPGAKAVYVGDTHKKWALFDWRLLAQIGVTVDTHGKMPDIVVYYEDKDWLVLIEAVTSHGPVGPKRRRELSKLFADSSAGLVFVTAFLDRRALLRYLQHIAWETEVWVADAPSHMIHFNGERFLGPY